MSSPAPARCISLDLSLDCFEQTLKTATALSNFILGVIVGAVGALVFFIYDEGELFLKLSRQIKQTAERYKQSS